MCYEYWFLLTLYDEAGIWRVVVHLGICAHGERHVPTPSSPRSRIPQHRADRARHRRNDHPRRASLDGHILTECLMPSRRHHGQYERKLTDLPVQGRGILPRLRLQRFLYLDAACPRRTFSEYVEPVVRSHATRSERLRDLHRHLGLALGGAPAARLARRLAIPVSGDMVLSLVRAALVPARPEPRVVGIDEWAWRRGRSYGTLIVDLERHTVIDLLPDRDATSVAGWLRAHPGIEIVARDRAEIFAEGVRAGAPQALDRFHFLCNLGLALHAIVPRRHTAVRVAGRAVSDRVRAVVRTAATAARPPTALEARKRVTHAHRHACHAELKRLAAAGASVAGRARALGLDRKTVRRWLRREAPPTWQRRRAVPTILDPHRDHLEARWQAGCRRARPRADPIRRRCTSARGARLGDEVPTRELGRPGRFAEVGECAAVAATLHHSDG
ncbi:hypothetical protein MFUR16E_00315 [Methylobacterium fujisawaense]|uniref:ISL3 family transposase n=1 Tax=Methylobacterium fujisawaense TaxID=107400 RepID=UPI002F2F10F8